ncbi:hypothetical protein Hanom_Chr11g01003851 [Helianthus anomalus]
MIDAEADPLGFVLVGESSELFYPYEVIRRVFTIQKKRKAKEVMLLKWREEEEVEEETPNFVLIGKPSTVHYSLQEIVRRVKINERRKEAKRAHGEIVDSDSNLEIMGDEDEEEEEENKSDNEDKKDDKDDNDDKKNDDHDQGALGLMVENPNVELNIEDFLIDQINEQEDDDQQEASTSEKQHVDQRTREEMLEELGLEDGEFKFDIEEEIPQSLDREFEPRYAHEADHYSDVIVEDASYSSDDETNFHYSGVDETFPSFAEMFKDRNEDEIRRKIVEKVSSEGKSGSK